MAQHSPPAQALATTAGHICRVCISSGVSAVKAWWSGGQYASTLSPGWRAAIPEEERSRAHVWQACVRRWRELGRYPEAESAVHGSGEPAPSRRALSTVASACAGRASTNDLVEGCSQRQVCVMAELELACRQVDGGRRAGKSTTGRAGGVRVSLGASQAPYQPARQAAKGPAVPAVRRGGASAVVRL